MTNYTTGNTAPHLSSGMKEAGVVILAAGRSERMKEMKAFLPFDENTRFIEKIISTFSGWGCSEIVVVTNPETQDQIKRLGMAPSAVTMVVNDRMEFERFYSVKLGLGAIRSSSFCFIQNVDNPFIDSQILDLLYQHRSDERYVSPVFKGKGGHPVLLSRENMNRICKWDVNSANFKEVLGTFECLNVEMNDDRVLININSPAEYERYFNSPEWNYSMGNNQIIFYATPQGNIKVEVVFEEENFWLTQKAMAMLFGVAVPAISKHLKNIFESKELEQNSVVSILETTAADGKNYQTTYYRLEAILAVGYRVNSSQATQFRIWATNTLKEFITKGFVLDDERLKQGKQFGKDYFDELLERIREIRASERRFYQKITDLYALSIDYNKEDETTQDFFASVQNKLHWAITGKTAAEIIYTEADATKIYMGLNTWRYAPDGKILKSDIAIAKNYLNEAHILELNRIVSAYLDLAENNALRQQLMYMKDWSKFLTDFLQLSNYPILKDKGKVTMLKAKLKADGEFEKYRVTQDRNYESDFDKEIKKIKK